MDMSTQQPRAAAPAPAVHPAPPSETGSAITVLGAGRPSPPLSGMTVPSPPPEPAPPPLEELAPGALGPTGRPIPVFTDPPVLQEHGPARVGQQLGRDPSDLLGGLARTEDHLGQPRSEFAVGVDLRVAEIGERKAGELFGRLARADLAARDGIEPRLDGCGIHEGTS